VLNLSSHDFAVWVTSTTELALTPTAIALGNFDGLHLGHQQVIQPILPSKIARLVEEKSILNSPSTPIYSTVVSFNPHPQEFFSGKPKALLTPKSEKVQQLLKLGVEQLALLPFDRELAALSPEEFVEKILVQQLRATYISVGQDFHFGSKRSGTAKDLQTIAAKYNIPVTIVPLYICDGDSQSPGERISSSLIRQNLQDGNINRANQLLGRPYTLQGKVIEGQRLGRSIGFPTANLEIPPIKFLPRLGVYAVRVFQIGETLQENSFISFGVMNIGNRPTVNGINISVEVHLLDWSGDLYGKKLSVQLEKFIRPEQKFPSLEELKSQILQDCLEAKNFFQQKR
jgi:riboflavin kinase / FMN adenylyltransferase